MKRWDADYYDKNSFMQYQTAMAMLSNLSLKGNETILDVGSGSGKISFEIAKKVPNGEVMGIDLSEQMTQFASAHYKASNLCFEKCDVVDMTYENHFDVVVSFWTLSWVNDQKSAFINIIKSLKEKGRVLLMYPMRHDVYDVIDRIVERVEWNRYFHEFPSPRSFIDENTYRVLLSDLKLDTLDVTRKQLECRFNNKEEMMQSIRSWLPHLDRINNENEKFIFVETITEEYRCTKNSDDYVMHFNVLEISGCHAG